MSADLLAEFDSFYTPPSKQKTTNTPASNDLSFLSTPDQTTTPEHGGNPQQWQAPVTASKGELWGEMNSFSNNPVPQATVSHGDIWGSFETSASQLPPAPTRISLTTQQNYGGWNTPAVSQSQHTRARSTTLDLFSNNMQDHNPPRGAKPVPAPPKPAPVRQPSYGADVLFDADQEVEDEDDFGDFETVAAPEAASPSLKQMFGATSVNNHSGNALVSISESSSGLGPSGLPYPQAPISPSFRERNPFGDLAPVVETKHISSVKTVSSAKTASPVTAWPNFAPHKPEPYNDSPAANNADDEWGDFSDLPVESPAVKSPRPAIGIGADAWGWDNADGILETVAAPPVNEAPPTNIPPPSVILTLFPPLFNLPQASLFQAVANQPFSLKNRIISDPSTINFLRAYLLIATVAARIIAGRKLRWKRDTILSQAMKIGPAVAGGKGGMKLAGVDKSEIVREDREASDVVRIWKEQLGRLKSAVAVANTSLKDTSKHLTIPDIAEVMHVKTQEGALLAPKQCLVCGLKREERVAKVDVDVEDSFGEWWAEHWGHRACKNFWQEHEAKLKGR